MAGEALKARIRAAFAHVEYPGDDDIRGSNQGDEPFAVEAKFRGQTDWRALTPEFIDESAVLCFLTPAAFRFYIPAYLLADVDGNLDYCEPIFDLYFGLDDAQRDQVINPRLYGERTWFELKQESFAVFTRREAEAIVAYMRWYGAERCTSDFERHSIDTALRNYWLERAGLRSA